MEKDKSLMEAAWWDKQTEGETGSCSDGFNTLQLILIALTFENHW